MAPTKSKQLQCAKCGKTDALMWTSEGKIVKCLECKDEKKDKEVAKNETTEKKLETSAPAEFKEFKEPAPPKPIRRSTRSKSNRGKSTLKDKGRRSLFKKTPVKCPTPTATTTTRESLFYEGSYFQVGDIVSLMDEDDDVFYAQIKGLMIDQYCEKSAVITWLLPTQESPPPKKGFDPSTYILGPEEELPRKLECMEFIMHAPSDYFKAKNSPYPTVYPLPQRGFIWTSLKPVYRS